MAENNVLEVPPSTIRPNDENPRIIFREEELASLQESISERGILVPLTVFKDELGYTILDGERRWRCATRLGLPKVPIIVQPKPDRLTNIMMMFAIHKTRRDWDPLPTAYKLADLEAEFVRRYGRTPREKELASAASLSAGEVRRYRRILALPEKHRSKLMDELKKPRPEQVLTVDHVLEATRGAEALAKRGLITRKQEALLADAIIVKFERKIEKNTVAPRRLPQIALAYDNGEINNVAIDTAISRLISDENYTIEQAFSATAEFFQSEKAVIDSVNRFSGAIERHLGQHASFSDELRLELERVKDLIERLLRSDRHG